MKKFKTLIIALGVIMFGGVSAQSVDEIVNSYFENTGGYDNWGELKGIKMIAKVNQGGMEIPLEIVYLKDGRTYTKVTFQGQSMMQGVYDGETMWSTNFQTMKAEKSDTETIENMKLDANDFPDSFYDYKSKGYTAELIGTESIDGADAFKIKLVKEAKKIDGKEVEDVTYYYFDAEAFVPLMQESEVKQGPAAGKIQQIKMSDYDEVSGYYFPFSMIQGMKGGQSQPLKIESIEVNPEVDDSVFTFPVE